MALRILSYPGNKNAHKALIAAQFGGVEVEYPPFDWGVTNKTEKFEKLTPLGKVPVLETPKGSVFESNAIAKYISRIGTCQEQLLGADAWEQGQVDQWIDFASNEIGGPLLKWAGPVCGWGEYKQEAVDKLKVEAERGLAALEKSLTSADADSDLHLVGSKVTLADIITVAEISVAWQCVLAEESMKPYPKVVAYMNAMLKREEFRKVLGEIKQAPEVPTGPLSDEKNPFVQEKRKQAETASKVEENEAKKSKTAAT